MEFICRWATIGFKTEQQNAALFPKHDRQVPLFKLYLLNNKFENKYNSLYKSLLLALVIASEWTFNLFHKEIGIDGFRKCFCLNCQLFVFIDWLTMTMTTMMMEMSIFQKAHNLFVFDLRNKTSVRMFYCGNKIWVRVRVLMK